MLVLRQAELLRENGNVTVTVHRVTNLRMISQELVRAIRKNVSINRAMRENVRARMRVIIKRILRKFGHPPDKRSKAAELVLHQTEVICGENWAA